jgi:PadR family transcriptional regulator, regulatory protein PadR
MTAFDNNRAWHDLVLSFMKIPMLRHAAHGELYGVALSKGLRCHGCPVSPGTMHPVLHETACVGYPSRTESVAGGKVGKYCSITDEGERALAEAKEKISALVEEVVGWEGPASWPNVDAAHSEGNHHEL